MAGRNKVYITGASGRLGASVLAKTGGIPLVRKAGLANNEVVTDFSTDQLKGILKDAKAVIHLAGSVNTMDQKELHESNIALTWRVVDSVPDDTRIIFASSISVYGKKLAKIPANEETKANPDSHYAKSKLEAEKIISKHKDHVILRIGTVYGQQFDDYFGMLRRIEAGKMRIIGKGDNRIPFVHVDDVAEAIKNALEKGSGVYVLTGDPATQRWILDFAAKELGVTPPSKSVMVPLAMMIAWSGEQWYRVSHVKPKLSGEHIAILSGDRAFDCSKAKKELGFAPRSIEQGLKEMVAEYKIRK